MMRYKLSNKQLDRLDHAHALRLALPYDGRPDDPIGYARSVLPVPPEWVREADIGFVRVWGNRPNAADRGSVEGNIGSILRQQSRADATPILSWRVQVVMVTLAKPHRPATETCPPQWPGAWEPV